MDVKYLKHITGVLIILSVLFSCTSGKLYLNERYYNRDSDAHVGYYTFLSDSTFHYTVPNLIDGSSSGKYSFDGEELILNSYSQEVLLQSRTKHIPLDSVKRCELYYSDGRPFESTIVMIKDHNIERQVTQMGANTLELKSDDLIITVYSPFASESQEIDVSEAGIYQIFTRYDIRQLDSYTFFKNDTFLIKKDILVSAN